MSKYKVVLFDLDGTISNTSEGVFKSAAYALKKMGKQIPDDKTLSRFIGPPLHYSFEAFCNDVSTEEIAAAVAFYRERYVVEGVHECRLYDGIKATIKALKEGGIRLGVATAKPQLPAEDVLQFLGVYDLFDTVSGEFDNIREDKDLIIEFALNSLGVSDRSEVLMVGDRFYDIEGAKKLGLDSVGVTYGFGGVEELKDAGATYLIDDPKALISIVID